MRTHRVDFQDRLIPKIDLDLSDDIRQMAEVWANDPKVTVNALNVLRLAPDTYGVEVQLAAEAAISMRIYGIDLLEHENSQG